MTHKTLKLKSKDYSAFCRDCNFSICGETYNTVILAKKHAKEKNHSVEYYVENGKVFKLIK